MAKLKNDKHEAFCLEYMKDSNRTQSAIRAGYSEKTAESQGSRLLRNDKVRARIDELQAEARERNRITLDEVVKFLADVVRSDVNDYVEGGPFGITLRDLDEIPPEKRRLIQKVSFKKGSGTDFELPKKLDAAEKIMKHLGGYKLDKDDEIQRGGDIDWTKLTLDERINLLELIKKGKTSE